MDIAHLLIQSISCEKAQGDKSEKTFVCWDKTLNDFFQ